MKYLKLFEWWKPEYKISKSIGDDIRDICLELQDEKFEVSYAYNTKKNIISGWKFPGKPSTYYSGSNHSKNYKVEQILCDVAIFIIKPYSAINHDFNNNPFSFGQVSECILRLQDFVESEGYQLKISITYSETHHRSKRVKSEDFKSFKEIVRILEDSAPIPRYASAGKEYFIKKKNVERGNNVIRISLYVFK